MSIYTIARCDNTFDITPDEDLANIASAIISKSSDKIALAIVASGAPALAIFNNDDVMKKRKIYSSFLFSIIKVRWPIIAK